MRTSMRDSHFFIWKDRVEHHFQNMINMNIPLTDIPDEPYRIWFDETNFTPKQIAEHIYGKFWVF